MHQTGTPSATASPSSLEERQQELLEYKHRLAEAERRLEEASQGVADWLIVRAEVPYATPCLTRLLTDEGLASCAHIT